MFRHSTNTASFFSVLIVALIFSLSLAGVAAAQTNTSLGTDALSATPRAVNNTAIGVNALLATGSQHHRSNALSNTRAQAAGNALFATPRAQQHRHRSRANVSAGNLTNATAIGNGANVNASNKIRLGNTAVTVIEGQVAFTCQFGQDQEGKLPAGGWRRSAGKDSRL